MEKLYDLSAPQKSILLMEQFYNETSINNIGGGITVNQTLNFDVFKKAINNFVKYNDSFRIRLKQTTAGVKQYFEEFSEFDIPIIDLNDETEVADLDRKILSQPFHIFDESLFQFTIFRFPNHRGGYVIKMHHLISDAWTSGLLCRKIMHEYSNLLNGNEQTCNAGLSYQNYLETEKNYFSSAKFEKDKLYWQEKFTTIPTPVTVPSLINSSDPFSCNGNRLSFVIPKKDMEQINHFCTKHSVSVFNFFMAILSTYLCKTNDVDDLVIGTPILNRANVKEKNTAGMFVNTAALRVSFENKNKFVDLISSIAKESMGLLRHQKYPYQTILENVRKKNASIPNLYNVVLSYQITRSNHECDIPYDTRWSFNGCVTDDIDIHLYDMDEQGILNVAYDYKTNKYNAMDIETMHHRFMHIIKQVLEKDEILVDEIEIITPKEKDKILYEFNNTSNVSSKNTTVLDLWENQARKTPNNVAIVFEDTKLTYYELNEKANLLVYHLMENGLISGDTVSIRLDRSLAMIISIIACIKLGITYVLIEKTLPDERIQYIINDSNSKMLITSNKLNEKDFGIKTILIDNFKPNQKVNHKNDNHNKNLVIIYTSGSTGNPKGVVLTSKGFANLVFAMNHSMHLDKCHAFLSHASVSFDMFAFELYCSLLMGKTFYLTNDMEQKDPISLGNIILNNNIDFMLTTPSKLELFLNNSELAKCLAKIKVFLLGGEVFTGSLYNRLKEKTNGAIYNGYGPTEITACCSIKKIENANHINIGKPVQNAQIFILDRNLNLCPIGTVGELCVAGVGLAAEYINNQELTDQKFVEIKSIQKTVYRTGDLAKFTNDGEIEYMGRNDFQVKLHGQRIELGEIEQKILNLDCVKNSCVCIKEVQNRKILCAYYIATKNLDKKEIKKHLEKELPSYMIPAFFEQLQDLPLTMNGKVDRKKLPMPILEKEFKKELVKPQNDCQQKLSEIVKKILGLEQISITDDFFELGGDSLSAINLTTFIYEKLNVKINIKTVFENPTILELSDYILNTYNNKSTLQITRAKNSNFYPLSSAQKRIYYASVIEHDSVLYNISGGIIVDKKLDISLLEKAFNQLIERHEILRTHFDIVNDEITQIIEEKIDFHLVIENETSDHLNDIYNNFIKPFDLSKAPLFRAKIVPLENDKMLLLLDMHHIISDGTSLSILLQELCDLYNEKPLIEKQIDYKDFTLWEKEQFEKKEFKNVKDFWVNQYQDEIPLLNMPTTFSRPSLQSFEGASFYTTLSKEIFEKINKVAKNLEITPYMLMLSIYYILLSKYTAQDDIVVGTPIVGRELPELYNMLGMFVNTLALRRKVNSSDCFKDFVNEIKEYCLNAFQNQTYPFDELVKALNIKRDTSRNPLFDVMFVYQNNGYPSINLKNTKVEYFVPDNKISKFDLSLEVIPVAGEFLLRFEYCTKLFDEKFIKRFSIHYSNILNTILENPDVKINDIDMLSQEEKYQILHEFNNTYLDYPRDKTIVDLFEEQVKQNPNKIAVVFEDKKLTYSELNKRANSLAHTLISKGVQTGDRIGIYLERNLELIVSIFATLKAGAVYMPMYTGYPSDRLTYMLKNSNAKFLITNRKLAKKIDYNVKKILINNRANLFDVKNPQTAIHSTDLAYCIYTSGSTGKPKGVKITHRNLINFVFSFKQYFNEITSKDTFLASTNISFDVSIWEIFMPLLNGAKLVLNTEEIISDITLYCDTIIKNKITALYIPPNILDEVYHLLTQNKNVAINKLLVGVEAIRKSTLNKYYNLNPDLKIINGYGPTETTICATALQYVKDESQDDFVSIGKPLNNNKIYILDTNQSLCAIGIPGEIYISGDGVGNGYLNNPSETNKLFIKEPFSAYKTGDLAKWNEDGTIHFIGRNDNQIKLSGYRIELNEINSTILSYPNISKCYTTILKNKNNSYLVAYFVSDNQIVIKDLKAYLQTKLTFYMIPKFFIQLETLPITINGKVDKKALPVPNLKTDVPYVAPRNDYEKKVSKIVRKTTKYAKNQH